MQTADKPVAERRGRTRDMVDKLLRERQEMLVAFCEVAGLEPYTAGKPVVEALQSFCEVLVDYSAFGHFEIYDRILKGEERRQEVMDVARGVYPQILETTEFAVAFNDKYDATDHAQVLGRLSEDLSRLGEEIALRIEMEDRLVSAMLGR